MAITTHTPVVGRTPNIPASIRMHPVGDVVYVAFCDDAVQPHYLEVAGNLYVFMHGGLDYIGVIDAISAVMSRLPSESVLYGCPIDTLIQPDWISQIVTNDLEAAWPYQDLSTNVRRHIQE